MWEGFLQDELAIVYRVVIFFGQINIPAHTTLLVENRIPKLGDDTAFRAAFKHCNRGDMVGIFRNSISILIIVVAQHQNLEAQSGPRPRFGL